MDINANARVDTQDIANNVKVGVNECIDLNSHKLKILSTLINMQELLEFFRVKVIQQVTMHVAQGFP